MKIGPLSGRFVKIAGWLSRKRLLQIATITVGVIFLSSMGIYYFEQARGEANIRSIWDGIWWAVVTMGTVGYGDKYPITLGGKIVGLLLIFSGVGLMSLLTATIASMFVEKKIREEKGLESVRERDHIIICGWNQYTEDVLLGLTTYGSMGDTSIVLINELSVDEIDSLRLKYSKYNLRFLRGNYVHEDVLLRANITRARFALIMADTSGSHAKDRIDERTTLAALTIKSIAPVVRIVAELLDSENRPHLQRASVDEIIVRGEHVGSFLASAINSPGLPKILSGILSLGDTNKLWRIEIPRHFVGRTFKELSAYYRGKHAILLGLLREKRAMKLEDLLSDDTSVIDTFIKERIRESKKDLSYKKDEMRVMINPEDEYIVGGEDFAVALSRTIPHKM
ncbi:MAG: ion channel [Syntrophales bacterium]|nr:ion channel [Syntrophales bacterium]